MEKQLKTEISIFFFKKEDDVWKRSSKRDWGGWFDDFEEWFDRRTIQLHHEFNKEKEVVLVKNAGHFIHVDQPKELMTLINEFIDGV